MTLHSGHWKKEGVRHRAAVHMKRHGRDLLDIIEMVGDAAAVDTFGDVLAAIDGTGAGGDDAGDAVVVGLAALRDVLAACDPSHPKGGKPDLDAAVRWHGAQLDDVLGGFSAR